MLSNQVSGQNIWAVEKELVPQLNDVVKYIDAIFPMKTIFLEWTDACPGVGIANKVVKYRASQRFCICKLDFLMRHHLANDDSSRNEVECVQSYVGDAPCDGAAFNWEYKKLFVDFTSEQLSTMSLEQFQALELKRMAYNANKVCEEAASRVDGAPAPGGYLSGYVSKRVEDHFFSDHDHLFLLKGDGVPGSAYYKKLSNFIEKHCLIGLKYMHLKKCDTDDVTSCTFCQQHPQIAPPFRNCPQPYPDLSRFPAKHYLPLQDMYQYESIRSVDDYNPRVRLTSLFADKKISLGDVAAINEFSKKYVVDEKHVKSRLEHLEVLALKKLKKKEHKKTEEANMTYEKVDWVEHYRKGTLKSLKVATLNLFIMHWDLTKHIDLKKKDKLLIIQHSISKKLMNEAMMNSSNTYTHEDHEMEMQLSEILSPQNEDGDIPSTNEVLDIIGDLDEEISDASADEEEQHISENEDQLISDDDF